VDGIGSVLAVVGAFDNSVANLNSVRHWPICQPSAPAARRLRKSDWCRIRPEDARIHGMVLTLSTSRRAEFEQNVGVAGAGDHLFATSGELVQVHERGTIGSEYALERIRIPSSQQGRDGPESCPVPDATAAPNGPLAAEPRGGHHARSRPSRGRQPFTVQSGRPPLRSLSSTKLSR
jgi:hypothetical protein